VLNLAKLPEIVACSEVISTLKADVAESLGLSKDIKVVAGPIYANARGAAWIAAVGLGEKKFSDVPKLVKIEQVYTLSGENRALYADRFDIFTQIYKQMKPVYSKMNG